MTNKTTSTGGCEPWADGGASSQRNGRHGLLFAFVVAVGLFALAVLVLLRRPVEQIEPEVSPPVVEVCRLLAGETPMVVQSSGAVRPGIEVDVVSELTGRVVFAHSELKAGGVIRANERIVQIDPREYELGVRQARAALAEAQASLDVEVAEAEAERRQWAQLSRETEPDLPLALREPRIRRARAVLESANAQLAAAELKLERTTISLPFDAMIAGDAVDLGQYVAIGQRLATAWGIDAFEVELLLDGDDVAWLELFPASDALAGRSDGDRILADVRADFAGGVHTWTGYVARTIGQVDLASRLVPVVVEIPRPLEASANRPPLLPGVFVEVRIPGKTLNRATAVPLAAVRRGNRVWIVEDDRMVVRPVEIVRTDAAYAYVTSGLPDEVLVVAGPIAGLTEGMAVCISEAVGEPSAP
ncbi:MAG: efflux RND transporter periplasmic adaptor subunit [Planctomycetes bacterium]|nr:efflux RND transporter periplasmic adaptor subunit [Planctomycetota bacterium]